MKVDQVKVVASPVIKQVAQQYRKSVACQSQAPIQALR
jgi:hypothetical protein